MRKSEKLHTHLSVVRHNNRYSLLRCHLHHHLHLHLGRSSSPHLPLRCALPPRVVALLLLFSVCRLHLSVLQPRIVVVCLLLLLVVVAVFAVGVKVKICSPYCKSLTIVELSTMNDDRVFIVVTVFVFVGAVCMCVCAWCVNGLQCN